MRRTARHALVGLLLGSAMCSQRPAAGRAAEAEPASSPMAAVQEPVRVTDDGYFKQRPCWSPDGRWLVFARHRGSTIFLFVRSSEGSVERRLTKQDGPEYDAVWSPDGTRLAFSLDKTSPNQGDIEVFSIKPDGEDLQPVAVTGDKLSHEEWPSWSPDGSRVAYSSTRDGNQELYVIEADGKQPVRLTSHPAIDAHPAWSPDGQRIAFATDRFGDLEIAVADVATQQVTRLTHSRGLDDYPAWSPDGKQLAITSNRSGNFEIWVMNADGSGAVNLTRHRDIDNFPAWGADGRITFVSNRDAGFDVYTIQVETASQ